MPIRAMLFDFDGTLADSFAGITASTNHVRQTYGLPELTESVVRSYVGFGLVQLMTDLIPGVPSVESVACYRAHHATAIFTGTKLFPGVMTTLEVLHARGIRMAICSNKAVDFTKRIVTALGLDPLMQEVLGPEDVPHAKPAPDMLLEATRRLNVQPDETIYVGDMVIDVLAGHAAKISTWLIEGGATGHPLTTDAKPDRVFATFAEMLEAPELVPL